MDHGYRKGRDKKSVPTTSSLQLDKRIVADSEGLHLGDVMNAGTLGFGEGTYCIHGLFKNERGGVQEVLEGQDLWQEDFINDGEVKASSGYRMDQTQGIFSKLGKVSVRGQGTTKVSERAVRQKTGGTTWQHTGHLEMDEWLDESESGVTFENKGTIISRHKTTVAAHFENGKGGTADFTEVSFDNFKDRYARLHNQGELTLRRIRSLGQARRDIFNSHGAKLTLLDCGYSLKEWDSTTGGFTLGKVDNYGVIGFRGGNFYTKVFTNHHEHEALPGQWLWSDDFINHGVTKIHTKHYLVDYTRGGTFSKLGKIEALKGGVMIKFSEQTNAAQYVSQLPLRDWKLKDHLTIWAPIFHNTVDWGVGFPLELLIASFLNDAKLHSYGLTLKARTYAQGTAGHRLGEIKCSGPLVMEVEGDIDNRNGRIEAEGEGEITSTHGDILLGQGVGGDYRQKNGAFAYSAKGLKLKARNMHISFGEVGSGQRLELKFLEKLVLESATVRSRGKSTFQGRSVVITRAAPYYSQGETVCDWRFWCNQWRHRDGGDAAQVLSGGDLSFLVDDLTIVGSHVTAMGDITDKYGVRRTKDNLGYFSVQPMDYYEHAEKHDKWPATVHNRCDSRGSTFSASGQINLTFSQYQLASLMMAASGIGLQGDGFLLGSASATSSHALVLTSGYISLLPALQSMVGGITHYRSPQENPYVVYSTGSFTTNVIDPALLTLVRDSMTMASFLMNPTADCRHLRQLTDEEGLIAAIQLVLMAATGKGYLFPKKGAGEHICLLLDNARSQQKEGRSFTLEEVKRSKVPLLTAQPQTLQGETVAVPCLYLPPGYITEHLFEPSQGTMVAEVEGIHVNMSTFLGVSGGVMAAEKKGIDLASGGGMALRSAVERIGDAHNHRDQMTRAAFYAPGDGLRATAAEEMTLGAIRTRTGVGGTSITGASVVDGSVALQSHRTTSHEGGETRTTMVTHAVSDHQSQGPFAQTATRGAVEAYAHQVTAPTVALSGHAGVNIHDVHNTVQTTTTTRESSGFLGGSTTVQEESASSRSQGAVYQTEKPVEVSSAAGSVRTTTSLRANHGITFKVPQGALEVIASMDFSSHSRTETGSSVLWQSVSHDASASRTYSMGEISGPVRVRARDGVVVETVKGKTLEWLARLDAGDSQVIQRELEEEHRIHHFDQEGPTMALAAVISLAVTIATSGTGASLGASVAGIQTGVAATTAQAFVQGAVQTAFTGICSQAAIGLVRHQGHIGMAVQDLTSSNSLRSIGIAAITAGTVQGVGTALGKPGTSLEATLRARKGAEAAAAASRLSAPTLAQRLEAGFQQHFQHHAVRTAVSSAIQMGTAQRSADVLRWSVKGLTAGVIGAMVANEIGYAAMADPAEPLNPIVHKMLHAGVGAGTGAIMDGADGARAGAIGGVVAEVMAEVIKPETDAVMERVEAKARERGISLEGPGSDERISALIQEEMRSTVDLSRLSGAVAALLTGQDVATAEVAATNAVENNFLRGAVVGGVALYRLYRIANAAYRGYRAADLAGRAAGHMAEKLEERAKAGDAGKTAGGGGGSGGLEPDPGEGTEDHDREQFSKETKEILGRTDRFKGELFERAGKSKDQTTLSAAQKELKGDQIPLAQERGMTYDHITKVRDAQGGLLNLVDRINRRLGFPGLPAAERLALQQELSSASRLLDHTKSFVPRS
jgi:hypothetical protein